VEDPALWEELESTPLAPELRPHLDWIVDRVRAVLAVRANESTVWSRAIFPLLMLAETATVRAWSQVPARAELVVGDERVELVGVIDGVLARETALGGAAKPPFLLVIEGKRAVDATDPGPQVLAALLASMVSEPAAAGGTVLERFGCFTVGDTWTFVRAEWSRGDLDARPTLRLAWSREYAETSEGERLLAVLRGIVLRGG
jgi:hypothetical protein